jgi:hypothetical protein
METGLEAGREHDSLSSSFLSAKLEKFGLVVLKCLRKKMMHFTAVIEEIIQILDRHCGDVTGFNSRLH